MSLNMTFLFFEGVPNHKKECMINEKGINIQ